MYNMDLSIFGFKLNLEILILIGVVYLILVAHTVCGCCKYSLTESSFALMEGLDNMMKKDASGNSMNGKEGFVGANTNFGQSSPYDITSNIPVDTSSWSKPDMTVVPGQPLSPAVKQFLAREPQPVPLPEGEMLMFANTPFKPECCPNTYSTSTGCACLTGPQYNYLITRGGNNTPYSEF
jgi:hypothetical protein